MLILGAQLVLIHKIKHAFIYIPCRKNGKLILILKRLNKILSKSGRTIAQELRWYHNTCTGWARSRRNARQGKQNQIFYVINFLHMNHPSMTYMLVSHMVTTQLISLQHTCYFSSSSSSSLSSFALLHFLYIPGWDLTSIYFYHFSLDCILNLQILYPTSEMSSSNLSHHLNFGLSLLSPFPPRLIKRTFIAGSLSSILITCPAHLSLEAW